MKTLRIPRRIRLARLLIAILCLQHSGSALGRQPSVVVILTDDQGWGDLSANGNTNLSTPNIDSLASSGASFESFYVCPVCSPTRAEFLTGRYHPRGGVHGTSAGGERLDLDETTIADTFKAAGFATGAFGKWHNGMQYPYHPNGRGFDEFYGFCSGHWGDYFSPPLEHNGASVKGKGFTADDFTDHAIQFIESNREQPFLCYLAFNTPHSPMQVPDEYWDRFKDKELGMRHHEPEREDLPFTRAALAMCENIDWNVGRLLDRLEALDLAEETIVVFFSDNGPNSFRWNGGMKGRKGSTDEGGVKSPLLVRWPGRIEGGLVVPEICASIDLLPTLCDLAGIPITSSRPLDGISLSPLLTMGEKDWSPRMIFSHWNGRVSVRDQNFRLDHEGQLFGLATDLGQRRDVSAAFPEQQNRLSKAVERWKGEVLSELGEDTRTFVVGHPGSAFTQIPARDGAANGRIERSNRYPNCSYFTNWVSTEDEISWEVEVPADGRFKVDVYYTCPNEDVGSTFELSFKSEQLQARLTEPHDPPIRGMENDRVVRMESYVKDFKRWEMGEISLPEGIGTLKLRAVEIASRQAMEFRMIMLTRVER